MAIKNRRNFSSELIALHDEFNLPKFEFRGEPVH